MSEDSINFLSKKNNSIFVSPFIIQNAFKSWIPNKNLRIEYKVANLKLTAAIYIMNHLFLFVNLLMKGVHENRKRNIRFIL